MREDWVECQFGDLLNYKQPTNHIVKSTKYNDNYNTPVLTAGKTFIKGYTNETDGIFKNLPTIIFDDFTTASQFVDFEFKVKSSAMKILIPTSKLVNMKFVFYCMQINKVRNDTHKRYWISIFSKKKFLLPPLPIQLALLTKLENQFALLDKGIVDLKKAQEQLKIYRQAVLKKAFEGELTKEWRENMKSHSKSFSVAAEPSTEYKNKKIQRTDILPDGWKWLSVENSSDKIVDCLHSTPKFQSTGKYCVDTTCISNGQILWDKIRYVTEESFHERIRRLKPEKDDILFAREGTVGTTVVLNNNVDICLGQRMMMFRLIKHILPKFFMYYFQSNSFISQYKPLIGGTTSPHLNIRDIKKLSIPICSHEEQNKTVREIESRLSVCDKVEQSIAEGMEKAEALRQSTLKKAFKGKLLSETEIEKCKQEPDYEPASELLKKIKTEKK